MTSERADGDFAVTSAGVAGRRAQLLGDRPVTWLKLTHGNTAHTVTQPGEWAGSEGDAAVTTVPDAVLAVTTADCAPVVLGTTMGVAVVHAGWKGLLNDIIPVAADALVNSGGEPLVSFCGPCVDPSDYAFSPDDLDKVANHLGDSVRAVTADGQPALDMFAAVAASLERLGWPLPEARPPNTAAPGFFSHRVRQDPERMMTAAWCSRERPG